MIKKPRPLPILSMAIAIFTLLASPCQAGPTLSLTIAAGSSTSVLPGDTVLIDVFLEQTTVTPGQDLINDGVGNYGFTIDLSQPIGAVTDFTYGAGFEPDMFLIPGLPDVLGQSTAISSPFVTKAITNSILLGTIELTVDNATATGSQTNLSVSDYSSGINFIFGDGLHGNMDAHVLATNPFVAVSVIPEPSILAMMTVPLVALLVASRSRQRNRLNGQD